jgi:D-alanyl-D-alanine carboxypeptidase
MRWVLPLTQALPIFASMAFLAAGIIPSAAQGQSLATAPPVTAAIATLDREIAGDIQAHGLPGLSIAVTHGDEILWHHDYGVADLARGDKVGPATRFRLGSISKLFTALAILQLRDAGKLDLDDRVTKTLPWFHMAGDAHPALTIRELLLHLSGLPADAPGVSWTDRVMPSSEQVIQGLPQIEPAIPAESTWKYSNLGYVLLGFVVEAASAESYAGYIESHVLKPLGMTETLVEPEPQTPHLAIGYGARGPDGVRDPRAFLPMGAMAPAAGITSTVFDMARLAVWALQDGDGPVLSARSRREMLRSQADFSDFSGGQGLGWEIRPAGKALRIGHAGKAAGYAGKLEIEPASGLGVVVLVNADENGPGRIADRALDLLGPALAAANPPPPVPVADPAWQDYVGIYGADHRDCAIVIANGRLAWQDPAAADPARTRIYLEPAGKDRFKWASGHLVGEAVEFERDAGGKVTRMVEGGYYDIRR